MDTPEPDTRFSAASEIVLAHFDGNSTLLEYLKKLAWAAEKTI
jgi:hypothetical protein